MALVTAAQFPGLTANPLAAIAQARQFEAQGLEMDIARQQMEDAKLAREQTAQSNALARTALGLGDPASPGTPGIVDTGSRDQALLQLAAVDPDRFEAVNSSLGLISDRQKQQAGDFAFQLQNTPFAQRAALIQARVDTLRGEGRDFQGTADLLNMPEDQQNAALRAVEISTLPAEKRIELMQGPELTTLQRNIQAAGFAPGTPEFQEEVLKSIRKPSGTQVNITQGGESVSAEQKEFGKLRAKEVAGIREEADAAESTIASLEILENIDVETGALEPAKQAVASVAEAFGINSDALANVSAGQAYNAEAKKLVLKIMATQKGPQTDTDRREIEKTVANLGNTKAGNQFIINSSRALAERSIERRDFFNEWIDENGSSKGANKAWNQFKRDTPMVSRNLRDQNGLPVFYYKFRQEVRGANPDATEKQILEAWRSEDRKKR